MNETNSPFQLGLQKGKATSPEQPLLLQAASTCAQLAADASMIVRAPRKFIVTALFALGEGLGRSAASWEP